MQDVLKLIDAIYASALDTEKWLDFLEQAAVYFEARGAQLGNSDLVNSRQSFSLVHGYDWSIEHMRRYESLMGEDPRIEYFSVRIRSSRCTAAWLSRTSSCAARASTARFFP